ncbi:MAG: hypothetical protein AUG51_10505 [Acidobacteria bacterium 13_1_20CM_3_53_8]|nr:MAG: hypothetical protein AUG51_10505 [Acidobacteria bacterium 13_1_20CM_3_53_8]
MNFQFASAINLSFDSAVGRALFVAALALMLFTLARYWRSLARLAYQRRVALATLRAASLLLLACALAGLQVKYERSVAERVLVRYAGEHEDENVQAQKVEQTIAALAKRNIEGREQYEADTQGAEGAYAASIILTDGAMSAEDAQREVERARSLSGGSPIYVVNDFSEDASPSSLLESIATEGKFIRGVPFTVRCTVHARKLQGRESLITVSDSAKVQASTRITWTSDDERQTIALEVVPKLSGWVDYTARVEAPNNETSALPSRTFSIYAEERRLRVLFFEGEPTWEGKFVRRALEQTGLFQVDYFAQVSKAAATGFTENAPEQQQSAEENQGQQGTGAQGANANGANAPNNANANSPEAKLHAALATPAQLNSYDAVIVGATPNTLLSAAEAARLRDWVERRGGGLIIMGGNSFAGSIAAPNGKLHGLLPAEVDQRAFLSDAQELARGTPVEVGGERRAGTPLTPTQTGASGALRGLLSASEGANSPKNDPLTGIGFRLSRLRAGASVLAVNGQANAEGTSESGSPLIAAMRDGAGRVIVFAPADSWRLRTSASGEQDETGGAFGALWQGLALWSSAGARPPVELSLSGAAEAGREVAAELRVRDQLFAPVKITKVSASLQPLIENGSDDASNVAAQAQNVLFAPDRETENIWRATFRPPASGHFTLNVDYVAVGKSGSVSENFAASTLTSHAPGEALDSLSRLAHDTGGELITLDELNGLAERLSARQPTAERVERTWNLRTWWPLAFIIPLLLSAEWLARRWWQVD